MTLGEFIKTQKGISSFGLYESEGDIIETQLSLAAAIRYQNTIITNINFCIVEDSNRKGCQAIRACIYVKLYISDNR